MLFICIIIFSTICFSLQENFLPPILISKVYGSGKKLWMKFLQKELEARQQKATHISSLFGFYNKNLKENIFKGLSANCEQMYSKTLDGIETTIYGHICGSSKGRSKLEYIGGKSRAVAWKYFICKDNTGITFWVGLFM